MVKGKFTISSGRMTGSYKERSFDYEIIGWVKDNEYTPHDQHRRESIKSEDIPEAETIYIKVTGGTIPDGEEEYRYLWGPFRDQKQIEEMVEYMYIYGSE
jgi:hypothetical protein